MRGVSNRKPNTRVESAHDMPAAGGPRASARGGAEGGGVDRLFAAPGPVAEFKFDERVAAVFADMIRRSVPGYEAVAALTGVIAARHLPVDGRCYDLGCSLGAATREVLRAVGERRCELVAVDASAAMLRKARALAEGDWADARVRWRCADIRAVALAGADVVIANYALQFLPASDRLPLLRRIRAALAATGVLLIAEKLAPEAPAEDGFFERAHLDFKRVNGYSDLEIAGKRAALENVMRIDSEQAHMKRLRAAGFAARLWFRCLNWGAFAAWPSRTG